MAFIRALARLLVGYLGGVTDPVPVDDGFGPRYYFRLAGKKISGDSQSHRARQRGLRYLREQVRASAPRGLQQLYFGRAPIYYRIGATSHDGATWHWLPWTRRAFAAAERFIVRHLPPIDTRRLERVCPGLWSEWWYASDAVTHHPIMWWLAARRVLSTDGYGRQAARMERVD